MKITFPGWYFPSLKLWKGQLLDIWLLTVHMQIPPWDITILHGFRVWRGFTLFDTDWITDPIGDWISGLSRTVTTWIDAVWRGIISAVYGVSAEISGKIHNAWGGISGYVREVWIDIATTINRFWDAVIAGQANLGDVIYGEVHNAWSGMTISLDRAKSDITSAIAAIPTVTLDPVVAALNKIPLMFVSMIVKSLDEMARDYYERHSEGGSEEK